MKKTKTSSAQADLFSTFENIETIRIPSQFKTTIDITDFLPIIEHEHFQRLDGKKQTGLLYLVYRGAKHTRFEHSVGTFVVASHYADRLRLSPEDKKTVQVLALVHDIAHIAYSHNVEPLLTIDHETYGTVHVDDMADAIKSTGVDPERIKRMLKKETVLGTKDYALAQLVLHKVLGADKQDWMFRDCHHIGRYDTPDTDRIATYLILQNNTLMNNVANGDELIRTQQLYYDLHMVFYYNQQYLASQRLLQRAVQESIDAKTLDETELYTMIDGTLDERLVSSEIPMVTDFANRLRFRRLYNTVTAFKIDKFIHQERTGSKAKYTHPISKEEALEFLKKYGHPRKLTDLERGLNEHLGLKDGTVLVTTIMDMNRLTNPNEVLLWDSGYDGEWNEGKGAISLFDYAPSLKTHLMNQAYGKFSIRVITPEEEREKLAGRDKEITTYLREHMQPA